MTKAEQVCKRYDHLKASRGTWDSHWREIAELVYPRRDDFDTKRSEGEKRMTKVFDSSAIHANELLASAMIALNVNPSSTWFKSNTDKMDEEAKRWLDNASDVMIQHINGAESGFYTAAYEYFMEFCAFGTAAMFVEEAENLSGVRFQARSLSEIVVAEGANGVINTVFRKFEYTVNQIMERWPDNGSEVVEKLHSKGDVDKKLPIIHCIKPREGYDGSKKDSKNLPIESVYVLKEDMTLLEEGGYHEHPLPVGRFYKSPMEVYGRSPAMTALPDIKLLNEIMKVTIKGAQKSVDPPLIMPSASFLQPLRTAPSGINVFDSSNGLNASQVIGQLPSSNPNIGLDLVQYLTDKIRSMFFVDQLQLSGSPQMTATEVLQRTEEKTRLMAPILGRVQTEFLNPVLDRVFGLLLRQGKFGQPPESIPSEFEFEFTGAISQAQRQQEAQGFLRSVETMTPLLQINPQLLTDNINADALIRDTMQTFGVGMDKLTEEDARDEQRQAQAEAAQQQEQMMQMQAMNEMDKTNSEAERNRNGS